MQTDRSCKGCRDGYNVTDAQINRILATPMFQEANCVPDSVYDHRLRICRECPKLHGGHTCSMCGCIVQVTAKLKNKSCPMASSNTIGWQKYEDS
ncbi:DUF6171 family protein [Paenibacillus alba]|uniref:DUF6171 family protein n=2 Tax=Paenibacillus alba TaxID=1197127 RepID=A0ABU6GDP3_9BACL|nr:DUF6171 family protein [Paenibacillus alba]MEC0232021.1 DUF6171 family protein [Paenibacillus alba]